MDMWMAQDRLWSTPKNNAMFLHLATGMPKLANWTSPWFSCGLGDHPFPGANFKRLRFRFPISFGNRQRRGHWFGENLRIHFRGDCFLKVSCTWSCTDSRILWKMYYLVKGGWCIREHSVSWRCFHQLNSFAGQRTIACHIVLLWRFSEVSFTTKYEE